MKLGNKIIKIVSLNDDTFMAKLLYADKKTILVDLSFIFKNPKNLAAEVVKGNLFSRAFIESGALAWPNGLEICPDALKLQATSISKSRKAKKVAV